MSDIDYFISLPIVEFCRRAGIGQTLCREMLADGRLRAVRAGKKKLLVDVASWREYMHRQAVEGTTHYDVGEKARAVRRANEAARRARLEPKVKPKAERSVVDLDELELL